MAKSNTNLLSMGAIGSAILASICCIGPLVLAVLGLGGGALLVKFEPYRPYLLAATAGLLAGAFYLTYRSQPAEAETCEAGSVCARPSRVRAQKIALWIVAVLVVLVAAFPYYAEALFQ